MKLTIPKNTIVKVAPLWGTKLINEISIDINQEQFDNYIGEVLDYDSEEDSPSSQSY